MIELVFEFIATLAVLGVTVVIAVYAVAGWVDYQERRQKMRLLRQLDRADDDLAAVTRDAKRQMNDAAGQSWRNRFE